MLNSLFLKKNSCFICQAQTKSFICSHCKKELDFYQNLRGRCNFKEFNLHFTTPYYQNYKKVLWDLKFGKKTGLAKGMAYLMLEAYFKKNSEIPELLGYVPMGILKEKQRGFNQSKLLADELGKLLNKKTIDLLKRKNNISLYLSKNIDRHLLVKNSMSIKTVVGKKSILIVDDVMTTGATIREIIRILTVNGYNELSFLLFARQENKENLESWFT
ncbi:MAG: hypothetical protein PHQ32_00695 [Firmicutes bacterium]|nr:hypothetical protein [Bacillota bacterium]